MSGYDFFVLHTEACPEPPASTVLAAEPRVSVNLSFVPPTLAQLSAAPSEKAALELQIRDWGYGGMRHGWYEKDGHTTYGRFVGDAPHIFWQVRFGGCARCNC